VRDTEVTSTFMSSSKLMRFNSSSGSAAALLAPHGQAMNTAPIAAHDFDVKHISPWDRPAHIAPAPRVRPTGFFL